MWRHHFLRTFTQHWTARICFKGTVVTICTTWFKFKTVCVWEIDHWGDPDVDGRIILRWIFGKWEGVETGWSWLSIGTDGGHLWKQWLTFGFHKVRGISWLAAEPVSFSRRTLLHGVSMCVCVCVCVCCDSYTTVIHFHAVKAYGLVEV